MTYPEFVSSRFKTYPDLALTVHHATTGMVGEAIEALYAKDRVSLLKELGDFEFYFEALLQHVPKERDPNVLHGMVIVGATLVDHLATLVAFSGDLLDLSKKGWVYNKPLDELHFWDFIPGVRASLDGVYEFLGVTPEEVTSMNVEKLLKRYPEGYSDHAAQARADLEKDGR